MALQIQHSTFWDLATDFLLDSRFKFGDRPRVTKFVYLPEKEVLVLGSGRETPSHKAMMSAYSSKESTDTSRWVRAVVLREKMIIYFRQGVADERWYDQTEEMLRRNGMPITYKVVWGPEAREGLASDLDGFP